MKQVTRWLTQRMNKLRFRRRVLTPVPLAFSSYLKLLGNGSGLKRLSQSEVNFKVQMSIQTSIGFAFFAAIVSWPLLAPALNTLTGYVASFRTLAQFVAVICLPWIFDIMVMHRYGGRWFMRRSTLVNDYLDLANKLINFPVNMLFVFNEHDDIKA